MLCLGISARGLVWRLFKKGETVTSQRYCDFLGTVMGQRRQPRYLWDDQAAAHRAKHTIEQHAARRITRLVQVAKCQDLQLAEKMLALVSKGVYAENKQYESVGQLHAALEQELTRLNISGEAQRIAASLWAKLPSRLQIVVEGDGSFAPDRW